MENAFIEDNAFINMTLYYVFKFIKKPIYKYHANKHGKAKKVINYKTLKQVNDFKKRKKSLKAICNNQCASINQGLTLISEDTAQELITLMDFSHQTAMEDISMLKESIK